MTPIPPAGPPPKGRRAERKTERGDMIKNDALAEKEKNRSDSMAISAFCPRLSPRFAMSFVSTVKEISGNGTL